MSGSSPRSSNRWGTAVAGVAPAADGTSGCEERSDRRRADEARRPNRSPCGSAACAPARPRTVVLRRDRWRLQPAATAAGLLAFVAYSTWAAFRNGNYYAGGVGRDYLSPFYSPCLTAQLPRLRLGTDHGLLVGGLPRPPHPHLPAGVPAHLLLLPQGLLPLVLALASRLRHRRRRVGEPGRPRARYTGETRFPLVLQNFHRYFFYVAFIFAGILTWDAIAAFRFSDGVGVAVGTLVLTVNAVLIWAYTLGCHACRHLCGGNLRALSQAPVRRWFWQNMSGRLNPHHQLFAWLSLFWIAFTDFYIWLVASGTIHDPRII